MIELLSKRLRDLRIGRGLSQKQVAALIGVDSSTISTYESATRLPSYPVNTPATTVPVGRANGAVKPLK